MKRCEYCSCPLIKVTRVCTITTKEVTLFGYRVYVEGNFLRTGGKDFCSLVHYVKWEAAQAKLRGES